MPEVSVVIPFYNRVNWLVEAVQSVLRQTYEDFEVIIVDDGSDEKFAPGIIADKRIRYVRQENKGASAARNLGISLAQGKYVAFLDSDDLFVPSKLEKQVAYMNEHPDVLLTHTSYQRMTVVGVDLEVIHSGKFSGRISREFIFNCHIATPTVMIRRESLSGRLKFEESVQVGQGEDVIFWLMFAAATNSKIVGIDEPLTKVRMHGNNVIFSSEAQMACRANIIKYVIEENPDIASALPRRALSSTYLDFAYFYFEHGDRNRYSKYLKRAVATYPINLVIWKALSRHLMAKALAEIKGARKSKANT